MATTILPGTVVPEVLLGKENYDNWSACIKSYLLAQDLWDIIETSMEPPKPGDEVEFKAWRKKNAATLHAIQISCGMDILSEIKGINSAKIVWDTLAETYEQPEQAGVNLRLPESGSSRTISEYANFYKALLYGDMGRASDFITQHPDSVREKITQLGRTALHVAVLAGREDMVRWLVEEKMSKEDLEIRDNEGLTALAHTIIRGYDRQIVECMIDKNPELVTVRNNRGSDIPVVLALRHEQTELANYLFEVTPFEELLPERGPHGATAVTKAMHTGNFELATKLIRRCPRLAFTLDTDKVSPLSLFVGTTSLFGAEFLMTASWQHTIIPTKMSFFQNMLRHRRDNDMEAGASSSGVGMNDDDESSLDPFDIPITKNAAIARLRRSRAKAVSFPRADNIFKYYLDTQKKRQTAGTNRSRPHDQADSIAIRSIQNQYRHLLSVMLDSMRTMNEYQIGIESGLAQAIFSAVRLGIVGFVTLIAKENREVLYWVRDGERRNVLMSAVRHRQAKIFGIIYGLRETKATLLSARDHLGNNILHVAGTLTEFSPPDHITGTAALKMQRELQWFKGVEKLCNPMYRNERNFAGLTPEQVFTQTHKKLIEEGERWTKDTASSCTVEVESLCNPTITTFMNADGLTPRQLFTKTHKDLMKEGERWMKDTSTSCTVVGALIITIMFVAVFTVPSGNNQDTGLPIFVHDNLFKIFIITDSLSLFSSSASVLMFLAILTSRYVEEDFLKSLPKRMIIGICTIFFSIATMMIVFSTALVYLEFVPSVTKKKS
ncbi:hypothetical protein F2P56_032084 [Juglans regia]|nr:hypothetical protein F2P56_032084 [Juglans regia]